MSDEMREMIEQCGVSCSECGCVEKDYDTYLRDWFRVDLPHHKIEEFPCITFCMPSVVFCSILCFSGFGDRLTRIQLTGTDRIESG